MVITIIGILIALLLPAVQAAREAARMLQCRNNLKQIALGCLDHEHIHGIFPTGGWGWGWSGDPDRGFRRRQPGGWMFNILPYIEQQPLRDLGLGDSKIGRTRTAQTALAVHYCPSRRAAVPYPYTIAPTSPYINIYQPPFVGRSDYAGCAGCCGVDCDRWPAWGYGPYTLEQGDGWTEEKWRSEYQDCVTGGVFSVRGERTMADISDGASNTFLIGEKYLNPDGYTTGVETDDDQGWTIGYDYDVIRWTISSPPDWWPTFAPMQDRPGYPHIRAFGSAHAGSLHMAFCDGSIQSIPYSIDRVVYSCLGNRKDGQMIDAKAY